MVSCTDQKWALVENESPLKKWLILTFLSREIISFGHFCKKQSTVWVCLVCESKLNWTCLKRYKGP